MRVVLGCARMFDLTVDLPPSGCAYVYSVNRLYYKTQRRVIIRTCTMLTDIEEPVAFDRTPLTSAVAVAVGPRTPFSPERTFVTLPRGNPEIEPLAGALERQGATVQLTVSV